METYEGWRASANCGCRPATDEEFARTGEYIVPCTYHGEKYGTEYELGTEDGEL